MECGHWGEGDGKKLTQTRQNKQSSKLANAPGLERNLLRLPFNTVRCCSCRALHAIKSPGPEGNLASDWSVSSEILLQGTRT